VLILAAFGIGHGLGGEDGLRLARVLAIQVGLLLALLIALTHAWRWIAGEDDEAEG
jgi:hypothetical protein